MGAAGRDGESLGRGGPCAGEGQQLGLRGGLGAAAPLVLCIPGGNGIFGGSRAPGRNSRAAFGAQPQLSRWDPALPRGHRGLVFRAGGCSLWGQEGIAVTRKRAKLEAGCSKGPGLSCGSSHRLEPRLCSSLTLVQAVPQGT